MLGRYGVVAKTILVADDDRGHVSLLEAALKQKGYSVITAFDGPAALELAKSAKPDLIVLDVAMPGMDGDLVSMYLKAPDSPVKHIPIIIVTGLRTEKEILEEKEENMFAKPVPLEKFFDKVQKLIKGGG